MILFRRRRRTGERTAGIYRVALLVLCASAVAVAGPASAVAATTVAGAKYSVVFNGTGSENTSWQGVVQGDNPAGSSGQQTGTWTVADDNNGSGIWLPTTLNPAEEGHTQSFSAWHDDFDSSGHPVPVAASISESGDLCCDFDPPQLVHYTCHASSLYDNGMGTFTAGVVLGRAVLSTQYTNNNRTFLAGHADLSQPNGVAFDGELSCQDSEGNTGFGHSGYGGFTYPRPTAGDRIAYSAPIPFSSVGQATITVPASDQSKTTSSADCDPSDTMDWVSCSVHLSISGSYRLTKVCDGAITYTPTGQTGTCGAAVTTTAGTASGTGGARAASNGTVTVGSSSCAGPGACTDTTTVTGTSKGKHATRIVTYARATVHVAAGKRVKITVKLTRPARAALKAAGRLKTTVTIVVASRGEKPVVKRFKLTIKAPRRPKGKRK